jgi:hypothetical protein
MMERVSVLASCGALLAALLACKVGSESTTTAPSASAVVVAAAIPAKLTEVTFTRSVPKAGAKIDGSMKSSVKFTLAGKVYRNEEETAAKIDVQGSDEFRVTKAGVDVKTLVSTSQEGTDAEKKSVNPLQGSRYVVSRSDDGTFSALGSNGSPVAASLLKELKEHFGDTVDKDKSLDFLPNRAVKIGEKLIPSQDAVLAVLGQKDDGSTKVDGVELILSNADADKATFNVSLTFTTKIDAQLRMRSKLEGTIDVRPKDAEVTAVSLKGPLTILDASGNEKGSGDMSFSGTESTTK